MTYRTIDGFDQSGVSDGDVTCNWGHTIRKGRPVYWRLSNVEYDEWAAHCGKHARDESQVTYTADGEEGGR